MVIPVTVPFFGCAFCVQDVEIDPYLSENVRGLVEFEQMIANTYR